jgi:hypothetical protein
MVTRVVQPSGRPKPRRPAVASSGSIGATASMPHQATPQRNPVDVACRDQMIRQAAYFRSLHRMPCPGKDLEDWLAAEQEIDDWLARAAMLPVA